MAAVFGEGRHQMTGKRLVGLIVAIVITIVLGGAALIIEQRSRTGADVPAGFIH
jgi:hypothetical protein